MKKCLQINIIVQIHLKLAGIMQKQLHQMLFLVTTKISIKISPDIFSFTLAALKVC